MSDRKKRDFYEVFLQTLIVALIGAVLSGAAQFLYKPLMTAMGREYAFLPYFLGGIYGWLLGVLNFLAMGISLIYVTSTVKDRQEGQKKGQMLFMIRLAVLVALAVVGAIVPVFDTVALLISLALTWLGVTLYALIFRARAAKKTSEGQAAAENGQETASEEKSAETDRAARSETDKAATERVPEEAPADTDPPKDGTAGGA